MVPRSLISNQVMELLRALSDAETSGLLHSGWYTTDQVAELIGLDPSTLRRWRTSKPVQGPPFVQVSSRVTLYSIPDVEAWLESRRIDPAKVA